MKRFTLMLCCLAAVCSLGFWRLTAQPQPFIHAQGQASIQKVDHRRMEQLERHLDQLIHEAKKLEQAGKHEHAEKIRHEAEKVEQHLHQMRKHHEHAERAGHHEGEHHFAEAEQKRAHLLEAAENLMHAGKPELAKQLHHEAEEIERHLHKAREREHGHHPHSPLEPIMHELHGLRKEVAKLKEQIHELREVIHHAIKEHGDDNNKAELDLREADDDIDISVFEREPGGSHLDVKYFINRTLKNLIETQNKNGTKGKVLVNGKVQAKRKVQFIGKVPVNGKVQAIRKVQIRHLKKGDNGVGLIVIERSGDGPVKVEVIKPDEKPAK